MTTKTIDITETGATRLMAVLAAQEIRDFFNGCDNKEDAERSLKALLQIIDIAVPSSTQSDSSTPLKYPCEVCGSNKDCQSIGSDPCPRR